MMPHNKNLLLFLPVVLLVTYNVFMFMLFSTGSEVFWAAYAFTLAAFFLSTGTIVFCIQKTSRTHDLFYWPLIHASLIYLIVQIAVSFTLMAIHIFTSTTAILIQVALLAIFLMVSISVLFGANFIAGVDKKQQKKTSFIAAIVPSLEIILGRAKDPIAKDKLQALFETARYSDPVSHESLSDIENEISAKTNALSLLVTSDSDIAALCSEITLLFDERNTRCNTLK